MNRCVVRNDCTYFAKSCTETPFILLNALFYFCSKFRKILIVKKRMARLMSLLRCWMWCRWIWGAVIQIWSLQTLLLTVVLSPSLQVRAIARESQDEFRHLVDIKAWFRNNFFIATLLILHFKPHCKHVGGSKREIVEGSKGGVKRCCSKTMGAKWGEQEVRCLCHKHTSISHNAHNKR